MSNDIWEEEWIDEYESPRFIADWLEILGNSRFTRTNIADWVTEKTEDETKERISYRNFIRDFLQWRGGKDFPEHDRAKRIAEGFQHFLDIPQRKVDRCLDALERDRRLKSLANKMSWRFLSTDEISDLETLYRTLELWVLTLTLWNITWYDPTKKAVAAKLDQNAKYSYWTPFTPNDDELNRNKRIVEREWGGIIPIYSAEAAFIKAHLRMCTHILIFNPRGENQKPPRAFKQRRQFNDWGYFPITVSECLELEQDFRRAQIC